MPVPARRCEPRLQDKRFAELREGVWLRPDNLDVELTAEVLRRGCGYCTPATTTPQSWPRELWDLPGWVRTGRELLDEMATADDIPGRFVAAAAWFATCSPIRCCPTSCCPTTGRAPRCGRPITNFAAELVARRDGTELMEAT